LERFRKYMGKEIDLENVKNADRLNAFGVSCTYLPDPPEEFDEFEFRTGFNGEHNIVLTVAVEMGKIKRVMFSAADEEDPDVLRSLPQARLDGLLAKKGELLDEFFQYITMLE